MAGKLIAFASNGDGAPTAGSGYLALPDGGAGSAGPGVLVLHAWWGLTEPFRQVCDRLAAAGFVALAPDLYRGQTATTVEDAEALAQALNQQDERVQADLRGAVEALRQHTSGGASGGADAGSPLGVIGFSLGGAYALDLSVSRPDEIAAAVIFYTTYTGLDFARAHASYLCHFAEHDPFEPAEAVAAMEQELRAAGKSATFYTYPGTTHWFMEPNRPDAYDAAAATLAWERTVAFLNATLRRA